MAISVDSQRVKRSIEQLLRDQRDDLRLRDHLEGLRKDPAFPGLTWFWGPELYQRNRAVFREIILADFSQFELGFWNSRRHKWGQYSDRLESWLQAARTNRDTGICRRLLQWKYAKESWGIDDEKWRGALATDYAAAKGPAAQAAVLDEYDVWFSLDEPTATLLFEINRNCSKFLLKHLPLAYGLWGNEKRKPWRNLIAAAQQADDEELAFALYRRQIDVLEWQRDIEQLADSVQDADRLNDELRKRHLEGWGLKRVNGILSLLRRRERDVMPYVQEKLQTIIGEWFDKDASEPMLKFAESKQWWDLWTAVVRGTNNPKLFNREVERLLDDTDIDTETRQQRLAALAGVSGEWNWPGVGLARVHSLEDSLATKLYQRFPKLVRGPFKPNVIPTWWQGGTQLLAAAESAGDEELVDLLASRYVTRAGYDYAWNRQEQDKILQSAEKLAATFQSLRDQDEMQFARRAASILTQVPAYTIHGYDRLLRTNSLARLLFVRSFNAYLAVPEAVRDLIEGSEIHVQMLGYRVLAKDDDRARRIATETLDILLGTLLRPLHRKTRLAAFGALFRAAEADRDSADRILRSARQALRLPDVKYPKEELVGLMGQILHVQPSLRSVREQPTVYGLQEVAT